MFKMIVKIFRRFLQKYLEDFFTMLLILGFSLISGFEMLYWLLFKILFHKKDQQVAPEEETCEKCGAQ